MKQHILLVVVVLVPVLCWGQADKVRLANPSFEDTPGPSKVPPGWLNTGFNDESPPDVQPSPFGCITKPLHGNTYLGLVTRDNNTWESVGQKLSAPLKADTLYSFSVCLAVSLKYDSYSRKFGEHARYDGPVRLRIWGINSAGAKKVLLAESPVITNTEWLCYQFEIKPPGTDLDILLLEAFYGRHENPTNGNLLLDNCSALVPIKTGEQKGIVSDTLSEYAPIRVLELYNHSFELGVFKNFPVGWTNTDTEFITMERTHPALIPDVFIREGKIYYRSLYTTDGHVPTRLHAQHGERYLSLLAAEDNRRQQISQRLDGFLRQGASYIFSLYLTRSKRFWEEPNPGQKIKNFKNPLRLRIWGGTRETPNMELLAESPAVSQTEWRQYEFLLTPRERHYDWITLEAYYVSDIGKPYNGNILVDNCSPIRLKE